MPAHPSRQRPLLPLLLSVLCACSAPDLQEQSPPASEPPPPVRQTTTTGRPVEEFVPPAPDESASDWILLTSGEWLRGEIESMRSDLLEFDSDKLDTLTIDWEDVEELRSPRQQTIQLEGGDSFLGPLLIRDGTAWISGGETLIDRDELLSIIPGNAVDHAVWSGKLTLGFTSRTGNTQQTDLSASTFTRRETATTRFDSKYTGAYSKVEGIETTNNHRLGSNLDWFISHRMFVTPIGLDVFRDPFQNVNVRVTPYAALGYDIIDSDALNWRLSGGPAFRHTRFDSVEEGEDVSENTVAAALSSSVEWEVNSDVDFGVSYDLTVPIPETNSFNHHFVATLSVDLFSDFDLDLSFIWDRVNNPPEDDGGTTPERDDFRITVGVGWSF